MLHRKRAGYNTTYPYSPYTLITYDLLWQRGYFSHALGRYEDQAMAQEIIAIILILFQFGEQMRDRGLQVRFH